MANNEMTLFDFGNPADATAWISTDDVVMGGASHSGFYCDVPGIATFSGNVSLANNGGFAAVRSPDNHYDLDGYEGIVLRVRGGGKRFGFNVRSGGLFNSGIRYESRFETNPTDEWLEVRLAFSGLAAKVFGRTLPVAPPLIPARITSMGFIISDRQAGIFRLEIDWIKAYRGYTS